MVIYNLSVPKFYDKINANPSLISFFTPTSRSMVAAGNRALFLLVEIVKPGVCIHHKTVGHILIPRANALVY